jgi:aryl-alcohol dehydrogenase-like predicted oxidoreductase
MPMENTFTHADFGKNGPRVLRLGLSATYRPGRDTIRAAIERGVNVFFLYGFDTQMTAVLREAMKSHREKFVVITGPYNLYWGHTNFRKTLEKRLRMLNTDYVDAFLFLGVTKESHFPPELQQELVALRTEGKVRRIGLSTHARKFAQKLIKEGVLDAFMIRYNAAHRGAEQEIFPFLQTHDSAVISYTATRWRQLFRRSRKWDKSLAIPTPGMCYRFVLSNPSVDVCLTAPSNMSQLEENLRSLDDGPLSSQELEIITRYGDFIHYRNSYFMQPKGQ